jgi:hypothetical protein
LPASAEEERPDRAPHDPTNIVEPRHCSDI